MFSKVLLGLVYVLITRVAEIGAMAKTMKVVKGKKAKTVVRVRKRKCNYGRVGYRCMWVQDNTIFYRRQGVTLQLPFDEEKRERCISSMVALVRKRTKANPVPEVTSAFSGSASASGSARKAQKNINPTKNAAGTANAAGAAADLQTPTTRGRAQILL